MAQVSIDGKVYTFSDGLHGEPTHATNLLQQLIDDGTSEERLAATASIEAHKELHEVHTDTAPIDIIFVRALQELGVPSYLLFWESLTVERLDSMYANRDQRIKK